MNNINALELLIMSLYYAYANNQFLNEEGRINTGSMNNYSTKHTYDAYHNSESEKQDLINRVNEFYTGIKISKEEFVEKDTYKVYYDSGFEHAGSMMVGTDIGFGTYATIGKEASPDGDKYYVEFNPKYLNSKYHDGTNLTDNQVNTAENGNDSHTNSTTSTVVEDTNKNIESNRPNDSEDNNNNQHYHKNILFGVAVIGIYISIVTFFKNYKSK